MDEQAHRELLFLQDARLEDIREYKKYQWQSTYYAILADGAVLTLFHILQPSQSVYFRIALTIAAVGIWLGWEAINRVLENALERSRTSRNAGYALFDHAVIATRMRSDGENLGEYLSDIYLTFRGVVIGSSVLAAIVMWLS